MINAYIIVRDQISWTIPLIERVEASKYISKIIIVNNDSTYPETVRWLKSCKHKVYNCENTGHWSLWHNEILKEDPNEFFAVTDPDLDIEKVPLDWPIVFLKLLKKYKDISKVGCAIEIDSVGDVWQNRERRFWRVEREPRIFESYIDTTLFVGRTKDSPNYGPALRVAKEYTCKHIPWHLNKKNIPEDFKYYLKNCTGFCSGKEHLEKLIE